MKNFINHFGLLFIALLYSRPTKAQENPLVGFYDGSKMELVFNLYILPNQEFILEMIYGSEDRLLTGTWKEAGADEIILQENRAQGEPFIVYTSNGRSAKRSLNFKYFDQNTETALALGAPFQASGLKHILKPDEHVFSYEYDMEVPKDSSRTIYLSRSLSYITQEVYPFELDEEAEDVLIMYNALSDKPIFHTRAILKDGELYLYDEGKGRERIGKKQALPVGIEKELEEIRSYNTIPDTQKVKMDENVLVFHRIKPGKPFKADVSINAQQSYFGNEEQSDNWVESPIPPPMPPKSN